MENKTASSAVSARSRPLFRATDATRAINLLQAGFLLNRRADRDELARNYRPTGRQPSSRRSDVACRARGEVGDGRDSDAWRVDGQIEATHRQALIRRLTDWGDRRNFNFLPFRVIYGCRGRIWADLGGSGRF